MLIEKSYKKMFTFLKTHAYHMKYMRGLYKKQNQTQQQQPLHQQHLHLKLVLLLLTLVLPMECIEAVGYSYTRFVGPVAGPEHKIFVNPNSNGNTYHRGVPADNSATRLDYVAKPEYEFSYGVEDADAHILHNRKEVRDGDNVKGVYSLIDPDGSLRVVKYTADEANGFQAEVIRNGISSLYDQLKHPNQFATQNPTIMKNYNKYYDTHNEPQKQNQYSQSSLIASPYYPQQLQHINHQPQSYKPYLYNQYQQTPSTPQISYNNYNNHKNNIDYVDATDNDSSGNDDAIDDDDDDGNGEKPQYEVHEKPNHDDDHENEPEDEEDDNEDDNSSGHKTSAGLDDVTYKKKIKQQYIKQKDDDDEDEDEYDDDDDDDYYDENDSEELEDYDEAVQKQHNSDESDEYY